MKALKAVFAALIVWLASVPAWGQGGVSTYCWNANGSQAQGNQWMPCQGAAMPTIANGGVISGSITATAGVVTIPISGQGTVGLQVTGTWSGSLTIRASVDYASVGAANATWNTTTAVPLSTGVPVTAITSDGNYQINAAGFTAIQVYGTSIVSGTANIAMVSSPGTSTVMADNPLVIVGNVSNASSAVATTSTNVPTVAYNYGFNGTTWDQLQVDASKNLKVVSVPSAESGAGLSTTANSALAANLVVKASAGNLYSFTVSADSTLYASTWFLMIYNATSAPADGAVTPVKCYEFPANTYTFSAAFPVPLAFSTGITMGVSTTGCFTKTASTHALFLSGDYK